MRERAGEGRRRSGIHFEIASHPVRSPFFAASSSRHPPVAFSRLLPSGKATPPARFSPSFSLTLSFYLTLSGSLPFGRQRASPRILISSKVLFPLNRAATRNNALYVRVLRLSFLPPRPSSSLFSSSPVSGTSVPSSAYLTVSLVSRLVLSSRQRTRNVLKFVPTWPPIFLIHRVSSDRILEVFAASDTLVFVCFRHVTSLPLMS